MRKMLLGLAVLAALGLFATVSASSTGYTCFNIRGAIACFDGRGNLIAFFE